MPKKLLGRDAAKSFIVDFYSRFAAVESKEGRL